MAWFKKHILPGLVTALVLLALGGMIDMRLSLMRLETSMQGLNQRTERIERYIDSQQRVSLRDEE